MALTYLAGFDTAETPMSVVIGGTAGSGTATLATGLCAPLPISNSGVETYTAFATVVENALDAAVAGFTVTFDEDTPSYTISHASTFTLTWTGTAGASLRRALGFTATLSGANTYTSTVRPYYAIVPAISGRSLFSPDVFEPEDIVEEATADDDTAFGIAKERGEAADQIMHADWSQMMESKEATFIRSAASSAPWTWEHFFKHCRATHPFTVTENGSTYCHTLRAEGASFSQRVVERVASDYDGLWKLNLKTRDYGAAGSWTPANIAQLKAWLTGDAGITSASTLVSAWADQSSNGIDFVQATGTNQPSETTVNETTAINFDGTDNFMSCTDALSDMINAAGSIWHVQIAFIADAINTNAAITSAAVNDQLLCNTPGYWGIALANIAGTYTAQLWQYDSGYNGVSLGGITLGAVTIIDFWADGSNIYGRLNSGGTVTDSAIGTIPVGGRLGPIKMGENYNASHYFDGQILEWYATNHVLSAADQAAGRAYLASRWGGTV